MFIASVLYDLDIKLVYILLVSESFDDKKLLVVWIKEVDAGH